MEKRYACFELLTKCNSCGNPVPLSGPFEEIICSSCFKPVRISAETFSDLFNDFDEEYKGLEIGQGSGGTVFGGSGSYEYSYWLLEPRCNKCKTKLPEFDLNTEEQKACTSCGNEFFVFPASSSIQEIAPSVKQFITFEKPKSTEHGDKLLPDEKELKPIVMSCPKCGGTLSVTKVSERIMTCEYCSTEVYVPDAVWQRLHPVKSKVEWFVRLEGKTLTQMAAAKRRRDLIEEKTEIKTRKIKQKFTLKKRKPIVRYLIIGISALIIGLILLIALMSLFNYTQEQIENTIGTIFTILFISGFIFLTAAGALHAFWGFWFGKQGACKKALSALAETYGWKHNGSDYTASMGYINGKLKGREVEINPGDDYAVEVDIEDSPFYLKTELPAWPNDNFFRFTTGNERFDNLFPIRYADPRVARKIESSEAYREKILAPFNWFFDRWEDQLAVAKIDWSDFVVHLYPGYAKTDFSAGRYLLPRQIEPLLNDMIIFANALEDALAGKDAKLPDALS